jgi:hypothetical protein
VARPSIANPHTPGDSDDPALDHHPPLLEVDIGPAKRTQLTSPRARRRAQAQVRPEDRVVGFGRGEERALSWCSMTPR